MEIIGSTGVGYTPLQSSWLYDTERFVSVGAYGDGQGALTVHQLDADLTIQALRDLETPSGARCVSTGLAPTVLRRVITGHYDGAVCMWDLEHARRPIWEGRHTQLVNSVQCSPSDTRPEILSASRDGAVHVWDTRLPNQPAMRFCSPSRPVDCWVAQWDPTGHGMVAGYQDGALRAFDLRKPAKYWEHHLPQGVCDVQWAGEGEARVMLVTSPKGQFSLFHCPTLGSGLAVPMVASMASQTHSVSRSTLWKGRFVPSHPDHLMISTNDGYMSHYRMNGMMDSSVPVLLEEVETRRWSDCGIISLEWHAQVDGLFLFSCLDKTLSVGSLPGLPSSIRN